MFSNVVKKQLSCPGVLCNARSFSASPSAAAAAEVKRLGVIGAGQMVG